MLELMRPSWLAALVVLVLAPATQAQTRVDLFDKQSNRTGFVTVDERTGRIDTYDVRSNRTGYGQIDRSTGRVDFSDVRGNRVGSGSITRNGGSIREERR